MPYEIRARDEIPLSMRDLRSCRRRINHYKKWCGMHGATPKVYHIYYISPDRKTRELIE